MHKTLNRKDFIEVGYVKKTHGIQGEVLITCNEGIELSFSTIRFVFFEIEGLLVPFAIDKNNSRSDDFILLKLNTLDSKEKANDFVGCKLFVDKNDIDIDSEELNPYLLKGYTVIDETMGEIGKVVEINDFAGNLVLSVSYKRTEVMIPFAEDLIVSIDQENTKIVMDCPEGLFDLDE